MHPNSFIIIFIVDKVEVSEAKFFDSNSLKKWISESPDDFTPWAGKEFQYYFEHYLK